MARKPPTKSKSFTGYAVVDGERSLRSILAVKDHKPVGTYFGAIFFYRKFAVEIAKKWGAPARVAKVKVTEAK